MSPEIITILMFTCLFVSIFLGHPVGFSLGGLSIIFGYFVWGPECFGLFANKTYGLMDSYVLVALPLFIFMANMLQHSGIAEGLYAALHVLMGPLRGGLALATILVSIILAATTGVVGASVVAMGLFAMPSMLKRGFQVELTTGTVCAGGTLGILIPPSIMLVLYGSQAGISVGKLFSAAILPGLLLALLYMVYIAVICYFRPHLGPALPPEERAMPLRQKLLMTARSMVPPLFLIFAALGTILFGIATPTEAAGAGALGSLLIVAFSKKLTWQVLKSACYSTLQVTSMALILVVGASAFTSIFLGIGGGQVLENFLLVGRLSRWVVLTEMMVIVLILGCFLDWIGIIMIILPVFLPIADKLGFDPLWFALLICINLQMSFLTPPFGPATFYLKGVSPPNVGIGQIFRGVIPFIALQMIEVSLCIIFPEIILWLPRVFFE
jgi:tripartite ATP-independent transporter DctM subunit